MSGFGTLAYVLLQALAWVTGNYDRPGGLLVNPISGPLARAFEIAGLSDRVRSRVGGFDSLLGTLPGGILADEILEPGPERIRALVVLAGDPLRSIPGRGEWSERCAPWTSSRASTCSRAPRPGMRTRCCPRRAGSSAGTSR